MATSDRNEIRAGEPPSTTASRNGRDTAGARNLLAGWGRTAPTAAWVVAPETPEELDAVFRADQRRGVIARGMGRAYGDAAQRAGGIVVDTAGLRGIRSFDPERGVVTVGAGTTLDALMRELVPRGWFVPVSPGTRYVSVGGAVAADIHGKNQHRDGNFTDHVERLVIATPTGVVTTGPDRETDLLHATAGGMGLTGVIVEVSLRLIPVETSLMLVDTERVTDLDAVMARMTEADVTHRYSVAWIDSLATGRSLGRGVLSCGDHAHAHDVHSNKLPGGPLGFAPVTRLRTPDAVPGGALNASTMWLFNQLWFRRAPRTKSRTVSSLASFFHPLDGVLNWNRIYGKRGFLQYQFVVPLGEERVVQLLIERMSQTRTPSFLTVLKRFARGSDAPLSFPIPGWTATFDVPTGVPDLGQLLDDFDTRVAEAGGRVYLAKDARLRPELLAAMYPGLDRWRRLRDRFDPNNQLRSDLSCRLGLTA
jgi:decaprenylphospho-beta-D-ribofuranose 2-oxidase